jgi:hypothetical protein
MTESEEAFGHYVGHDEPQLNFYSAQPGSGNAMQYSFTLPGWVRQFDSRSCDATRWCAALTIDSLSRDPVAGQDLNDTCANQVLGGIEYTNFAYLTRSGKPQGPPESGCNGQNDGFDGTSYLPPLARGQHPPAPDVDPAVQPRTGHSSQATYPRIAFEADLPAIESSAGNQRCNVTTGQGGTRIPLTDDGTPAKFYPFYTKGYTPQGCRWSIGNVIPDFTTNDFGRNQEWGTIASDPHLVYGGGGATHDLFLNFRQFLANPCQR